MLRSIPLNAVRAFEAAARHQSVVRAADELCVPPTAVSHQIKTLEDFLQVKLFLRKRGRIELTPEAHACLRHFSDAMDTIDGAFDSLGKRSAARSRLTVGAGTSVASLWLIPRLRNFMRQAPEVNVTVTTFLEPSTFELQAPDLLICNW